MRVEILHSRIYGQPKLNKPSELRGIKQSGSAMFGAKCKCPIFVTDFGVYVKHRDWFSGYISIPDATTQGIIDKKKNKFIYNDNFGSVVLRGEAWIRISADWGTFSPHLVGALIRATETECGLEEYYLETHDWVRFYEDIIMTARQ